MDLELFIPAFTNPKQARSVLHPHSTQPLQNKSKTK